MDFNAASDYIIHRLQRELSPTLTYHSVEHTLDVLEATRRLADSEKIPAHGKTLLETAALYHDAGMLIQYNDHETASVDLALDLLPGFGYSKPECDEVTRLIQVTRLPQRPYDHHEQIVCDADLDYLGRDDFFILGFKLRLEWQHNGIKKTTLPEWFDIQVKFLAQHQYFTNSAIHLRNGQKLKHLEEIRQLCRYQ